MIEKCKIEKVGENKYATQVFGVPMFSWRCLTHKCIWEGNRQQRICHEAEQLRREAKEVKA